MTAVVFMAGCGTEPEPIRYGTDACEHCQMTLMDTRFGAELITSKGKVHKFDDVNCLISFMQKNEIEESSLSHLLFIDYLRPEQLVSVSEACFVQSPAVRSPMASQVAVFSDCAVRDENARKWDGSPMTWQDVKAIFE
jgi:copper chaperone NosL